MSRIADVLPRDVHGSQCRLPTEPQLALFVFPINIGDLAEFAGVSRPAQLSNGYEGV